LNVLTCCHSNDRDSSSVTVIQEIFFKTLTLLHKPEEQLKMISALLPVKKLLVVTLCNYQAIMVIDD
jgi:hypothetical protein